MTKKVFYLLTTLAVIFLLAGCSMQLPGSSPVSSDPITQAPVAPDQGQEGQDRQFDPANQPIEQKLAIGTLKLEDTDLAVTAEQARDLLPLWKAVKALSSSETVSQDEVNAVYTQIQEAMTEEQIAAIKEMSINPEDMQALMQEFGIEMEMPQGGNTPKEMTEEQLATLQAQRSAMRQQGQGRRQGGGMPGGGMPGGGDMPPGGMEGGMPGGMPNAEGTPQPGMGRPRGAGGGFNTTLVDPLIKLLQERAGA
jgi:hypothetical protein